jgi:hypothetical protein
LGKIMPVKAVLFVSFFFGALLSAQEVQQIDLTAVRENRDFRAPTLGRSMNCDTEEGTRALRAVRVSVESLAPTHIHPKEQISVILKVENYGKVPIVLPVGSDVADLHPENGFGYTASLPLMAGVPNGTIRLGWLELYGSTWKSNTTINLEPGEWITVRGNITVHNWYESGQSAVAYSNLLLYQRFFGDSPEVGENCFRQVSGGAITVHFNGLRQSP